MNQTYCANCFAELSEQGECVSCGWMSTGDKYLKSLDEFTVLQNQRYILGRVLGVGGFGITYAALNTINGSSVAIKEYMPSAFAERIGNDVVGLPGRESDFAEGFSRFKKEWQILSSLNNIKSIVRGHSYFYENCTAYIVMERLTGFDVKTLINQTAPQNVLSFCEQIIRDIGAALVEVHNKGIIHLDVSPANIFRQSDDSLRLIDFGSSIYINDPEQDTVQLKHGYAPPELYTTKTPKGPWTDVYSLAATYYTLISGVRVPAAETRLVNDELMPLAALNNGVPLHISESVQRALSLDLSARYKTVLEFLNDFINIIPSASGTNLSQGTGAERPSYPTPPQTARLNPQSPTRGNELDKVADAINKFAQKLNAITPKSSGEGQDKPADATAPAIAAYSKSYGTLRIAIQPNVQYKIGRASGPGYSDFVVSNDTRISKVHIHIRYDAKQRVFYITDISSNGTYFSDGRKFIRGAEYAISPGDIIYLGSNECSITPIIN